jgi:PAS domain S-box-containing protein
VPGVYDSEFGVIYRQVMAENIPLKLEAHFEPINAWFEVRVYPSKEGLSIYFADVTERYRSQAALREAEERLRTMIDSAKDYAIFAFNVEGLITSWNTGAERMFGYTEEQAVGNPLSFIFTREDNKMALADLERGVASTRGRSEDDRWHVRSDGLRIWISGVLTPIWQDDTLLGYGEDNTYRFDMFSGGMVEVLAAEQTDLASGNEWFQGTADAVRKQFVHIRDQGVSHYVILSGDQLYRVDYRELLETHFNKGADITVSALPVSRDDAHAFGVNPLAHDTRHRADVRRDLPPSQGFSWRVGDHNTTPRSGRG